MGNNRLKELDSLRGIAALSVCFFHFALEFSNSILPFKYFKYGSTGVDLFFMISGFVIFMSIGSSKSLGDFWFHRFNRLFPSYWLSIFIALGTIYLFSATYAIHGVNLLGNILMIQPIFRTKCLVAAYWTLYVELCFYVFISIIWRIKLMGKIELVIWLGMFLELIINGLYSMLEIKSPGYVRLFIITRNIMPLITYFGFFAAGIIYYKVYTSGWTFGRIIILIISALSVILTDDISGRVSFFSIPERIICEVFINALFILVVTRKGRLLKAKWLYFAGAISYPLYLVHESIGIATSRYFAASINRPLSAILGIIISILVATIITYLFEKPVHKWLKNLYFRKIKPELLVSKV